MEDKRVSNSSTDIRAGIMISTVQYQPTDRPIEDRFSITTNENSNRLIIGVYDGHGGAATAEHIRNVLPAALLEQPASHHARVFQATDNAMLSMFKNDHRFFRSRSDEWVTHAEVVKSGCTALVLDIDIKTLIISIANAGDSRAVMCSTTRGPGQSLQQTEDLNAKNPSEQRRLESAHPAEDLVIVSGRLFGRIMSTRGFGDGYYKLPNGLIGNWQHKRYINILSSIERKGKVPLNAQYDSYFYGYRTPPYLTAAPEVGTMSLQKDGFVIIATDGLWDCVSSEDAVEFVRQGIEQGVDDLAEYLLRVVIGLRLPGDDVTIILLRVAKA